MAGLKRTLVRVLRTSTTEVDRRVHQRHAVNIPCHLAIEGIAIQFPARVVAANEVDACLVFEMAAAETEQWRAIFKGFVTRLAA